GRHPGRPAGAAHPRRVLGRRTPGRLPRSTPPLTTTYPRHRTPGFRHPPGPRGGKTVIRTFLTGREAAGLDRSMTFTAHSSRTRTRHTGATAVALTAAAALLAGCSSGDTSDDPLAGEKAEAGTVVVGSNNFAESTLLADIYGEDRKSTRLNSSHVKISYAVFCLK